MRIADLTRSFAEKLHLPLRAGELRRLRRRLRLHVVGGRERARLARRYVLDYRAAHANPAWRGAPWMLRRYPPVETLS